VNSLLRKVNTPASPLERIERSRSGTLVFSISPRIVSSSLLSRAGSISLFPVAARADACYFSSFLSRGPISARIQSIGTGKMTVEFFSAAISVSVWR
jgi:hypothetical protein